jgi:hypothetical protein
VEDRLPPDESMTPPTTRRPTSAAPTPIKSPFDGLFVGRATASSTMTDGGGFTERVVGAEGVVVTTALRLGGASPSALAAAGIDAIADDGESAADTACEGRACCSEGAVCCDGAALTPMFAMAASSLTPNRIEGVIAP